MKAAKCSCIGQDTHAIYSSHNFPVWSLKNWKSSTPLEDSWLLPDTSLPQSVLQPDLIPFLRDWQRPLSKTQSSLFASNTHHLVYSQQWPYANTHVNPKHFWLSITFFVEVCERAAPYRLKTMSATHVIHPEESIPKTFFKELPGCFNWFKRKHCESNDFWDDTLSSSQAHRAHIKYIECWSHVLHSGAQGATFLMILNNLWSRDEAADDLAAWFSSLLSTHS